MKEHASPSDLSDQLGILLKEVDGRMDVEELAVFLNRPNSHLDGIIPLDLLLSPSNDDFVRVLEAVHQEAGETTSRGRCRR